MSTREAEGIVDDALGYIDRTGGLVSFFEEVGIGGVSMAFIYSLIDAVDGGFALLIAIPRALAGGFVDVLDATFGGYVRLIEAGIEQSIVSITGGTPALLGPFVSLLTLGIVMLSIWMLFEFLDRIGFSPLSIISGARS